MQSVRPSQPPRVQDPEMVGRRCFSLQCRIDRQKFSTEGLVHDRPAQTPGGAVSNVGKVEGSDVLQAATEDLLRIFQMKVGCLYNSRLGYDLL